MPVDWNSDDMLQWKDLTKEKQQEYCDSPHIVNWRECNLSDISNLKEIFGFPLSCAPEEETVENFTNISKIFASIETSMKKRAVENILVSVLFVLVKAEDGYVKLPVIKLLEHNANTQQDNNIYIDFCGRVYKNWEDYLKNNTLPKRPICYPKNGVYSAVNGDVEVEYGISQAGKRVRKVLRRLDIGGTVLGLGAAGVGIAALCVPVALPVVAGAFAVSALTKSYATGRSIQTLVDRKKHQQNIGLRSSESRSCWLGIAGNLMGFASGGATVAAGSISALPLAKQIVLKSVKNGSFVVNAVRGTNVATHKIRELMTRRKSATHLTDIYNCENHQSQKENSHEKMWGIVKDFMTVEVFHKECRISGIPNDRFFQEVFKVSKSKKNMDLHLLNLEIADTSAQDAAQSSLDVDRIRSHLLDNKPGLSCNGRQSEGGIGKLEAELTDDRDSMCTFECGDTAIIKVNDSADLIML